MILYYTILYYAILYYIILYDIILYYTFLLLFLLSFSSVSCIFASKDKGRRYASEESLLSDVLEEAKPVYYRPCGGPM